MDRIVPWLWIGDAADGKNLPAITAAGIGAVCNATKEADGWSPVDAGVAYLQLDQDDGVEIPLERLDLFAAWMAIQCQHGRHLLIHCGAGVSRSATFCTVALMLASGGVPWDECLAAVRKARPSASPAAPLTLSVLRWYAARDGLPCHRAPLAAA